MTALSAHRYIFHLVLALGTPFLHLSAEELHTNKKLPTAAAMEFEDCSEIDDGTVREDVISCYQTFLIDNPKHTWALNNLGYLLYLKKDMAQAREYLTRAVVVDPKFSTALINRANLFYDQVDLQHAFEDYSTAHVLDPADAGVVFRIAEIHHDRKQYKEAVEWYSKHLTMTDDQNATLSNRGLVYYQLSMNEKALKDFSEVIKNDPEYLPTYLNRALVYEEQKLYPEALEDLSKVLRSSDEVWTQVKALEQRARIYAAQGEQKKALADLDKALSLDPSNKLVLKEKMKISAKFSPEEKEKIAEQLNQINKAPDHQAREWAEANIKEGTW